MDKMISYAQNFEDIVLWRALKDVRDGCYIDIGANHPVCDSVTKFFYEHGWHGINIEPVKSLFDQLVLDRPRDINLSCAISSEKGQVTFYEVMGTGLSTLEPRIANEHASAGYEVRSYNVPIMTMADVYDAHNFRDVHFLKIDVEGAEKKVLEGIPFDRLKPWIIIVEATEPNTQIPSHEEWEHLLTSHGYSYVYFDGANRFYLSNAHTELASAFQAPPNVFDNFIQYPYWRTQQELGAVYQELSGYKARLAQIQASWTWRLTKPFRALSYLLNFLFRK